MQYTIDGTFLKLDNRQVEHFTSTQKCTPSIAKGTRYHMTNGKANKNKYCKCIDKNATYDYSNNICKCNDSSKELDSTGMCKPKQIPCKRPQTKYGTKYDDNDDEDEPILPCRCIDSNATYNSSTKRCTCGSGSKLNQDTGMCETSGGGGGGGRGGDGGGGRGGDGGGSNNSCAVPSSFGSCAPPYVVSPDKTCCLECPTGSLGNGKICIACSDISNMTIGTNDTTCSCKAGLGKLSSGLCSACLAGKYSKSDGTCADIDNPASTKTNIKYSIGKNEVVNACPVGFKPNASSTSCVVDTTALAPADSTDEASKIGGLFPADWKKAYKWVQNNDGSISVVTKT